MPAKNLNLTVAANANHPEAYLGIEGGGTRTTVLFGPGEDGQLSRAEFGPGNLRLLDDAALIRHFQTIRQAGAAAEFAGIGIGMAGARTESDRQRIRAAAAQVWPGAPVYATSDLETALAAADGADGSTTMTRVLVLSGTGSCFFGMGPGRNGATVRVGGWGHILGDRGSGYDIGLRALRGVIDDFDRTGRWPALGADILRTLQLNEVNDLIDWVAGAEKSEVAALAETVFAAAARSDRLARGILATTAEALAQDGAACAGRLVKGGAPVEFVLAGGILVKQPKFARQVSTRLSQLRAGARVTTLAQASVRGAFVLAQKHFGSLKENSFAGASRYDARTPQRDVPTSEIDHSALPSAQSPKHGFVLPVSTRLSPTEERNPRSRNLERLPLGRAVALMIREEGGVAAAVFKERRKIERAVELIVQALRHEGRLFYAGAGTSGRLGILDASECPPTFRVPPELAQGVIAGGRTAIWDAVEGAEDDAPAGAAALENRGVNKKDVVVGIAASGRTPFVWGALAAAKKCGASTIFVCFNPHLQIPEKIRPDIVIAPDTGPELLTGSTRLKAGSATKVILNIFTTLAMVRLGKVIGNLMVDLNPSNEKLRDRAVRIVGILTRADAPTAHAALEKSGWNVKQAYQDLSR